MGDNNNYGKDTPQLKGLAIDRLGIVSFTLGVKIAFEMATLGKIIFENASIKAAPAIGAAAPGLNANLPCVGVGVPTIENGKILFTYLYEGFSGDVTTSEVVYELEGTANQEPIETHPRFLDLFTKYGGVNDSDGRFSFFQAVAPPGIDGVPGVDGRIRNPMSGVTDYVGIGYIWRKTWLSTLIPPNVTANAGYIDQPPGSDAQKPPSLPNSLNWLKVEPRCRWRGNCWEINEAWMASGRNGWMRDMYTR